MRELRDATALSVEAAQAAQAAMQAAGLEAPPSPSAPAPGAAPRGEGGGGSEGGGEGGGEGGEGGGEGAAVGGGAELEFDWDAAGAEETVALLPGLAPIEARSLVLEGGAILAAISGMPRQEALQPDGASSRTRLPLGLVMRRAEALAEAVAAMQVQPLRLQP